MRVIIRGVIFGLNCRPEMQVSIDGGSDQNGIDVLEHSVGIDGVGIFVMLKRRTT